jgi:drug/metabolite transporter (DMT)-like permease
MSSHFALPAIMMGVVATAVSNTILRRIAMVPMERYPLFLTICQTLNYVIVYGGLLAFRIENDVDSSSSRPVTKEMLRIRKLPFLWIGLCDSLGDLLGNAAIGKLPGYQPPLLAKLNIVFTAFFSRAFLGEQYNQRQILSMVVVICGSLVTLSPVVWDAVVLTNSKDNKDDGDIGDDNKSNSLSLLFYIAVYISSVAPTALGFVLKEKVFREYEPSFDLDIFVVNTYTAIGGLLCQTVFFVPLAALSGVPYSEISSYMMNGYRCFTNDVRSDSSWNSEDDGIHFDEECRGSPLAPVLYLAMNIFYNIFFLMSIKYGGTLLTFITNTVTFPLSTLLFTCGISWPLLGSSDRLNGWIVAGLIVEVTGILWYYSEKTKTDFFFCCESMSKLDGENNDSSHENRMLAGGAAQKDFEEQHNVSSAKNPNYGSLIRGRS